MARAPKSLASPRVYRGASRTTQARIPVFPLGATIVIPIEAEERRAQHPRAVLVIRARSTATSRSYHPKAKSRARAR